MSHSRRYRGIKVNRIIEYLSHMLKITLEISVFRIATVRGRGSQTVREKKIDYILYKVCSRIHNTLYSNHQYRRFNINCELQLNNFKYNGEVNKCLNGGMGSDEEDEGSEKDESWEKRSSRSQVLKSTILFLINLTKIVSLKKFQAERSTQK
ncbi:hypothetical protein V1477_013557 [Vespula maculifrons]|uniref:Uncharacterized protein n=1 Tax=Vespula maculifrons TaxID=7453 RepID=A0ABD2BPY9_VESMC